MAPSTRKARGAYYTHPIVASFLVRWAVRRQSDRILEPCFGGGVFIRAAAARVEALSGDPSLQVTGVEMDPAAHSSMVSRRGRLGADSLILRDFFDVDPTVLGRFSAVVGNPPFIRYQRFRGEQRALALRRAAAADVKLTELTSAWAPFLVHGACFLEHDGRLAMVAPAELCHASYARPVIAFLRRSFAAVRILTFSKKLFPDLNENTVLLLAEGYGRGRDDVRLIHLHDASALAGEELALQGGIPVVDNSPRGTRLSAYLLSESTRLFYAELLRHPNVRRLGEVARCGIGYVSGNNEYFHLSAGEADCLRLPDQVQLRAVCRAGWLSGAIFTRRDWEKLDRRELKTRLLALRSSQRIRARSPVARYLASGAKRKVHHAYKCRMRRPWYVVPNVEVPDLFLTYMANERPALVINDARAVVPNTLLCVRIRQEEAITRYALAAGWWTSLSMLSAEVEGHSMGGGMLKLEPGEAINVAVALPEILSRSAKEARSLVLDMDRLLRDGAVDKALDLGDEVILRQGIGLSEEECRRLREAALSLSERRRAR